MNCSMARLLLAYARPKSSELETWAAQALHDHTAECSECACLAQDERQLERHLGLAMRQVAVPENLRERLLLQLQAERRTWYRRLPARHPRLAAEDSPHSFSARRAKE